MRGLLSGFTLAKPFGIPLVLTGVFNLLIAVLFFATWAYDFSAGASVWQAAVNAGIQVSYWLIVFFIVVLHEYGHALTAKSLGYRVPKILIHPFGGAALIEGDWAKKAKHEFLITVNGPLVNLVLALVTLPFVYLHPLLGFFFVVNVILLAFNLLPTYPMDGGRLVRSFLTWYLGDWWKATVWAFRIGCFTSAVVAPFLWMHWSPVAAILLLGVTWGLGWMEKSHLETRWLAEVVNEVNDQHKDHNVYVWMQRMSDVIVVQAVYQVKDHPQGKQAAVRKFTEGCWRILLDMPSEYEPWLASAQADPAGMPAQSFIAVLGSKGLENN